MDLGFIPLRKHVRMGFWSWIRLVGVHLFPLLLVNIGQFMHFGKIILYQKQLKIMPKWKNIGEKVFIFSYFVFLPSFYIFQKLFVENLQYYCFQMLSDDQLNFVTGLTVSIPLSYILSKIMSTQLRHFYSFILGTLLQVYVYGVDSLSVFLLHAVIYVMIKIWRKKCGKKVTIFSLVVLSMFHIYRMIVDYGGWKVDMSTILMTITCKYSLFAYAVEDGTTEKKLTAEQERNKIKQIPSFFRFLSYCQFLPTSILGTAVEYQHFQSYMEQKAPYNKIPSPWKSVFYDVGYSIVMLIVFVLHMFIFSLNEMKSAEFPEKGFAYILIFSFFSVTTLRFKYYFAWKFSQGAVHASGISYEVKPNGEESFTAVQTCNPEIVQSTKHVRIKIANWNMSCQEWLRKSIYQRSPFQSRTKNKLATFMVSSFWHGFYGGYYISFFFWFAQMHLSELVFSLTKDKTASAYQAYKKTGTLGRIILWTLTNVLMTVNGIYFQVLSLDQSLKILSSLHYIPPLMVLVPVFYLTFFKKSKKRRTTAKESDESSATENQTKIQ